MFQKTTNHPLIEMEILCHQPQVPAIALCMLMSVYLPAPYLWKNAQHNIAINLSHIFLLDIFDRD